jgi:hypothetical protein
MRLLTAINVLQFFHPIFRRPFAKYSKVLLPKVPLFFCPIFRRLSCQILRRSCPMFCSSSLEYCANLLSNHHTHFWPVFCSSSAQHFVFLLIV